ncbi:hypothetical protein [Psychroserpens algicola]|uniref:hypothetical protein n=1 Tax=Psychroserpens algicola TaxID=1719034 RepID=UPI001954C11D|nr:hypothetical protein [Psychroserpens algicola]
MKLIYRIILFLVIFGQISLSHANDTLKVKIENTKVISKLDTLDVKGNINLVTAQKVEKKSSEWLSYAVPIVLGLLAGLIALYQVKLNNITSAKIEWVRKFSDVSSHYLMNIDSSAVELTNYIHLNKKEADQTDKSDEYNDCYKKYCAATDLASQYYFQVKLLFYKNTREFQHLETLLDELDNLYGEVKNKEDINSLRAKMREFILSAQQILAEEWKSIERKILKQILEIGKLKSTKTQQRV